VGISWRPSLAAFFSRVSLSVFENQSGADESVHLAAEYVKEHLAAILGTPEITKGDVLALS